VLIGAGLATALAIWAIPRVGFDYNVLNLQAKGTESVAWERRILAGTGRSGFNGLSSASSLEELRQKQAAFEKLPSVSDVDSVLRVIPDDQAEKIAIIKSFAPLVAPIRVGRSSSVELDRLKKALADIKRRFDVVAAEAGSKLPAEVRVVREKTIAVIRLLERSPRDSAEAALNYLQAQLYRDFVSKFYGLQRNLSPTGITIKDVPDELRRKFIGENGRFPHPDPPQGRHLGEGGGGRVRARHAHGGSGRHRPADHHLRGDRAHGACLPHRHPLRVRARGRAQRPDDPAHAREHAGPGPDGAGAAVDHRADAGVRDQVQPRQHLGPAPHHRNRGPSSGSTSS